MHIICNSEYYIPNSEFENCQLTKIAGKKSAYVTQRNENGLAREEEPLFFWELLILQIEGSIQRSRITPIKANRVEKDRRKYGGNRFTPWGASKSELTSSQDFCKKCHCFIAKIVLSHLSQISIIVYFYLCVSIWVPIMHIFFKWDSFFIALYNCWSFYFKLNCQLLLYSKFEFLLFCLFILLSSYYYFCFVIFSPHLIYLFSHQINILLSFHYSLLH